MSAKRKLDEMLDEQVEDDWKNKPIKTTITKHSLDSDEEDDDNDGKAYEILDEDEIEGQEDGIAGIEGETHITPFNMKEEMEEGHFDTDGMYHWKKDGKEIKDNWLDNIDWVKIHKTTEGINKPGVEDEDSSDIPSLSSDFDEVSIQKEMLTFMKPKETVAKALRRHAGNKSISSAERWKRKKAGVDVSKEEEESKQNVSKLTELANKILQNTGNMDIYQESYEYISEKVNAATWKPPVVKVPELDMYAEDFVDKEKVRLDTKEDEPGTSGVEAAKPPEESNELKWEFKWEKESDEISGPHSSEEMLKWTEDGRFKKEVWVRKCGQLGDFYTSKRIDFDLYI